MAWIAALVQRFRKSAVELESSDTALCELEKTIGYRFRDRSLLINALKHRSYVYAQEGDGIESNERLEYLGDAVLDLLVADFLF